MPSRRAAVKSGETKAYAQPVGTEPPSMPRESTILTSASDAEVAACRRAAVSSTAAYQIATSGAGRSSIAAECAKRSRWASSAWVRPSVTLIDSKTPSPRVAARSVTVSWGVTGVGEAVAGRGARRRVELEEGEDSGVPLGGAIGGLAHADHRSGVERPIIDQTVSVRSG